MVMAEYTVDTVNTLEALGMIQDGVNILDVGCGPANWGRTILDKGYKVKYLGLDCQPGPAMKCYPGLTVKHIDVYNSMYNPGGLIFPQEVVFPAGRGSMDLVIAHSLFTHLGNYANADSYMFQIERVLKPGGYLWITFFQAPPNQPSSSTRRTVYTERQIAMLMTQFTYIKSQGGFTDAYHDQLMIGARYDGPA